MRRHGPRKRTSFFAVCSGVGGCNKEGKELIYAGGTTEGHALLTVANKEGKNLIYAIGGSSGGVILIDNITGENAVELRTDDYGHGYIGVWDRKGKGRTLEPGK